jgi:predicted O-methyltransferase YrrM
LVHETAFSPASFFAQAQIGRAGLAVQTHLHAGRSLAVARAGGLPPADLIFMDAEHYYEPIREEIELFWPLVAPGGLMVIHDTILFDGARRRVNELHAAGQVVFTVATSLGAGVSILRKP